MINIENMSEEDRISYEKLPSYYKKNRAFISGWLANRHKNDLLNTAKTGKF